MLRFDHPDWVAVQTRQMGLEGTGEVRLRHLVKGSLRMTIHANSARHALVKLCTLPLLSGLKHGDVGCIRACLVGGEFATLGPAHQRRPDVHLRNVAIGSRLGCQSASLPLVTHSTRTSEQHCSLGPSVRDRASIEAAASLDPTRTGVPDPAGGLRSEGLTTLAVDSLA